MSDKIRVTCPKCKHTWEQSLAKLEKLETIYKGGGTEKAKKDIVKYRAVCPVDGNFCNGPTTVCAEILW